MSLRNSSGFHSLFVRGLMPKMSLISIAKVLEALNGFAAIKFLQVEVIRHHHLASICNRHQVISNSHQFASNQQQQLLFIGTSRISMIVGNKSTKRFTLFHH